MSSTFNKNEISEKMNKTIMSFKKDLETLRTGRANPAMFDLIRVEVYGQKMPLNQLATITRIRTSWCQIYRTIGTFQK